MSDELNDLAIPHFRDFVAVSALGGLLSNSKYDWYPEDQLAAKSYRIAEEFLQERERRNDNKAS